MKITGILEPYQFTNSEGKKITAYHIVYEVGNGEIVEVNVKKDKAQNLLLSLELAMLKQNK